MLHGVKVRLRARIEADVAILDTELYNDVATRSKADSRPWRPIPPGSPASPYAVTGPTDDVAYFSVIGPANDDSLLGEALLWGIDLHNRQAHIGISLRPASRGQGLSIDVLQVLCHYAFTVRGLNRLQIETLADNAAMLAAATRTGFIREGTLRGSAWANGTFNDEAVLGLLNSTWTGPNPTELAPTSSGVGTA